MINTPTLRQEYKERRRLLGLNPPIEVKEDVEVSDSTKTFIWCVSLATLIFIAGCLASPAHAYTDEQLANAIHKAEGTWTYGIKTVNCASEESCRQICLRTIKNNKKRFTQYGHRQHPDFISFLGSRYCPIGAGNDPQGLNRNWLKNVRFFLGREV